MSFAAVSIYNPVWLQEVSRPGRNVEARDFREHGDNKLRERNYRLAISQFQRAVQIKPDYSEAMLHMGLAYSMLGDLTQAEQWMRKALAQSKSDAPLIQFQLAELLSKAQRYEEAARHYRAAINAGFATPEAYARLAFAYSASERWAEARPIYETALLNYRDVAQSYRSMLITTLTSADADSSSKTAAQTALERGIRDQDIAPYDLDLIRVLQNTDPDISRSCHDLGVACLHLGDTTRALELFQESLQIWPANTQAQNNLTALRGMIRSRTTSPTAK